MNNIDFSIDDVIKIVREAAKIANSKERFNITEKGKFDLVTDVDKNIQKYIEGELKKLAPDTDFMGEEEGKSVYHTAEKLWILDPIDGTTNLIFDLHLSAVSLALCIKGTPVMGIIFNPFTDEIFYAEKGKGAYLNGRAIHVSSVQTLSKSAVAVGTSPYRRDLSDKTFKIIRSLFDRCIDIRRLGSAALDLAYVACGRYSAYCEVDIKPWDYAAGKIIVEEAGGIISDHSGNTPKPGVSTSMLASNGLVHNEVIECIKYI